jgi:hypothetical protein
MRLTIIVDDGFIKIDGVARSGFDLSELRKRDIHAVQWHETKGEIEYNIDGRHSNEDIDSIEQFQTYIDAWNAYVEPVIEFPSIV